MEEQLLKLMARLGLLAVVVWIIAAAIGRKDQAAIRAAHKQDERIKHQNRVNSAVNYAPPVVTAPRAEGAVFCAPALAPITRY